MNPQVADTLATAMYRITVLIRYINPCPPRAAHQAPRQWQHLVNVFFGLIWAGPRPALQRLAAAQDEPDDLAAVGHPYRQRAGGVESESQPV
ncbi:hypothetical protein ACIBHX_23655 [Nonomuraea sp. NPDC050536]|uniref:hypothetical protein n=1 Tax=Nonomuraea sp. NPDC050536 TaxID=3364366 RepID=UPI0037CA5F90